MTYQPPIESASGNNNGNNNGPSSPRKLRENMMSPVLTSNNNNNNTTLSISNITSNPTISPQLPGLTTTLPFGAIDSNNSNDLNLGLSNNSNTWEIMQKDTKDILLNTDSNNNSGSNNSSDSTMNNNGNNNRIILANIDNVLNTNNGLIDVNNDNGVNLNTNNLGNVINGIDFSQIPPPPTTLQLNTIATNINLPQAPQTTQFVYQPSVNNNNNNGNINNVNVNSNQPQQVPQQTIIQESAQNANMGMNMNMSMNTINNVNVNNNNSTTNNSNRNNTINNVNSNNNNNNNVNNTSTSNHFNLFATPPNTNGDINMLNPPMPNFESNSSTNSGSTTTTNPAPNPNANSNPNGNGSGGQSQNGSSNNANASHMSVQSPRDQCHSNNSNNNSNQIPMTQTPSMNNNNSMNSLNQNGNGGHMHLSPTSSNSASTTSTNPNNNTSGTALGQSASQVDAESYGVLTNVEKDLLMGTLNHSLSINQLNVQAPYVLDALSQLLIYCIKNQTNTPSTTVDVHCNYYVAILSHIGKSLGQQCAVDGFIKCWIDCDTENTMGNNNGKQPENLCSFMHLVTRYNRLNLMQHTITLFPEHHKVELMRTYHLHFFPFLYLFSEFTSI